MVRRLVLVGMLFAVTAALPPFEPHRGAEAQVRGQRSRQSRARRRRTRRRRPTKSYRDSREIWHRRAPRGIRQAWLAEDPRPLVIRSVWQNKMYRLIPNEQTPLFGFVALRYARKALAHRATGESIDIHPRLLELMHRAVLEFNAPYVHVISGYRPDRATSRHTQGRAVDMVLPGVTDRRLAAYLRRQGYVGVGLYPTSGFVHVDVRERSSFWVDRTPPGARDRRHPMMTRQARRYDAEAAERGEVPVPDVLVVEEPSGE